MTGAGGEEHRGGQAQRAQRGGAQPLAIALQPA